MPSRKPSPPPSGAAYALGAVTLLSLAGLAMRGRGSHLRRGGDDGGAYAFDFDLDALIRGQEAPAHPKMCEVWLLNAEDVDGFFVSRMLREAFGKTDAESMRLGLTAHRQGRARVCALECEEARQKVQQAYALAAQEHPEAVGILDVVEVDGE